MGWKPAVIQKHKSYLKYKDSGIAWLGDIPAHWDVKRLRYVIKMNPSKQEIVHFEPERQLIFLPMESIGENGSLRLDTTKPIYEVSSGYTFFAEGDVAFAKITPCFENGKGAIMQNLGTQYGFGTTELIVMRPGKNIIAKYLHYLSTSTEFRKNGEAWMYGAGGQKRVPDEFVKNFPFAFPPLPEQEAIVAFLDRGTGHIDSLVAKKQKLIELLHEKRTALISHAVTKGLNPSVRLKPSGIAWLGDIPEHWDVKKIKYIAKKIIDGSHITPNYISDGVPFLRVTDIQEKYIDLEKVKYISEEEHRELIRRCKPELGDILISKNGTIGITKVIDWKWEFSIFVSLCLVKIKKELINANFFSWQFSSDAVAQQIVEGSKKTSVINLHLDKIKELIVIIPPLPEQKAIAEYLDQETARIDMLVTKIQAAIEKLREYRTALISSAVTGKIDVRHKL